MWSLFLLTAAMAIAGEFTRSVGHALIGTNPGGELCGEFTTSLGDTYPYTISAITTDFVGSTYIVGSRQLGGGATDVFVSKLDSQGDLYFTDTFAGKGVDTGTAIALDPAGNIYIAGTTTSNDFPLSNALQTKPSASGTGFIIKLTFDGSTILYSTYFGGTLGSTAISSLATDSNGNLYLTGTTNATDFPHTAGMPFGEVNSSGAPPRASGAIIASISAAGDKIPYSGLLAGGMLTCSGGSSCFLASRFTSGVGIGVDAAGNAYVAGNTNTTDLPTTSGTVSPTGFGAFVAKVNPGGAGLSYLTYLSPDQLEPGGLITADTALSAITVDAAGNAYLAGSTNDSNFPATPGSLQPVFGGPPSTSGGALTEGILAKLKPDGSAMVWATFLGGNGQATAQSIAVDASGNIWATGRTESSTFPNTNGWTTGPEFLVGLNAAGSKLTYSALYPTGTVAQSVAVDNYGVVVAGANGFVSIIASSSPFGLCPRIFFFQNAFVGNVTARVSPGEVISIHGPGIGPAAPSTAAPTNGLYPKTLAGVQVTINGMNMPLLYVSANQINAVVPMEVAPGAASSVRVINGVAFVGSSYPVWILASAPQAFPTVLNQDGTINSQTNPAHSGSIVTFYATGWQSNFFPLTDGQVATAAQNVCPGSCQAVPAGTVVYGGAAPGIVAGVSQLNFQIGPIQSGSGAFPFNFYVAGASGNLTQMVWVAP